MIDLNTDNWTYGAEHELADWDRSVKLPEGFDIDKKDHTIVNSNGIAADPKAKYYGFGGEINTPPTETPQGQADVLNQIIDLLPEVQVNYRSNLHIHIRVPGLMGDLKALKQLLAFNSVWLKQTLKVIEPIPTPLPNDPDYQGAMRRCKRRRVSHHHFPTSNRINDQLNAESLGEFFAKECPSSKEGKPLWHFQPRSAINIRQLLETDTIEFRHFPGTLNSKLLLNCVEWCRDYLLVAFGKHSCVTPIQLYAEEYKHRGFPTFPQYIHWMEERYRRTCHDGSIPKDEIVKNIEEILSEESTRSMPR